MSQHFCSYPDGSPVNTAGSHVISTPENPGPAHSSTVSIQSKNNTFRQRWQTSEDMNTWTGGERAAQRLILSPVVAEQIVPDGYEEDELPPPLPPRHPSRTREVLKRQYSDFEYGTMCFLALCCFLGMFGLVIALIVGAFDILSRLMRL